MVKVEDVPRWIKFNGIGHAVTRMQDVGWCYTACGSLITGDPTPGLPKRICRKCRARLADATLINRKAVEDE